MAAGRGGGGGGRAGVGGAGGGSRGGGGGPADPRWDTPPADTNRRVSQSRLAPPTAFDGRSQTTRGTNRNV